MARLLFFQGLPGSGKSTEAKKMEAQGWVRVNKDDIRAELAKDGWTWSPENEQAVVRVRDIKIATALDSGKDVISDDTNFGKRHKTVMQNLAVKYSATFETKRFDVPLEECLARNAKREGKARVPDHAIQNMWKTHVKDNPYNYPKSCDPTSVILEPVVKDGNLMKAIICDLDGTLAINRGHRGYYDATRADEDDLCAPVYKLIKTYYAHLGHQIIYLTGRDETYREPSQRFLDKHFCPPGPLHMRDEGDSRSGEVCKLDIFNKKVRGNYDVEFCLEDLDKVTKMWRRLGLTCFQVENDR